MESAEWKFSMELETYANKGYNPLLGLVFNSKVCVFLLGWIPTSENSCLAKAWQWNFTRNGIIA